MSWYAVSAQVSAEFVALARISQWEPTANAAWLGQKYRKRAWGAAAWRFDAKRRRKSLAAGKRYCDERRDDEAFRAKCRAKCKAYRERRKLDPAREKAAKAKRKTYYAQEWASLKSNAKRYAKKLAWTRAWRERQRQAGAT